MFTLSPNAEIVSISFLGVCCHAAATVEIARCLKLYLEMTIGSVKFIFLGKIA